MVKPWNWYNTIPTKPKMSTLSLFVFFFFLQSNKNEDEEDLIRYVYIRIWICKLLWNCCDAFNPNFHSFQFLFFMATSTETGKFNEQILPEYTLHRGWRYLHCTHTSNSEQMKSVLSVPIVFLLLFSVIEANERNCLWQTHLNGVQMERMQ